MQQQNMQTFVIDLQAQVIFHTRNTRRLALREPVSFEEKVDFVHWVVSRRSRGSKNAGKWIFPRDTATARQ